MSIATYLKVILPDHGDDKHGDGAKLERNSFETGWTECTTEQQLDECLLSDFIHEGPLREFMRHALWVKRQRLSDEAGGIQAAPFKRADLQYIKSRMAFILRALAQRDDDDDGMQGWDTPEIQLVKMRLMNALLDKPAFYIGTDPYLTVAHTFCSIKPHHHHTAPKPAAAAYAPKPAAAANPLRFREYDDGYSPSSPAFSPSSPARSAGFLGKPADSDAAAPAAPKKRKI